MRQSEQQRGSICSMLRILPSYTTRDATLLAESSSHIPIPYTMQLFLFDRKNLHDWTDRSKICAAATKDRDSIAF